MTEENFKYRTSQILLRNQFDCKSKGKFKIPIIPKAEFTDEEFENLLLIGFDRTKIEDNNNVDRMVHFFLYDYKFERVWKTPDNDIEKLKRYRAVLSPDFSMYVEMNPVMQLYNVFRNRWCGAYMASKGIRVVPTVSWGDESTFDFCFEGIPKGSTVAVSTYMVSEHGHHADQKEFFLKGYNEMLKRIEPERIICYSTPFSEMEGNIIYVDYELSSWKHQNDDIIPYEFTKYRTEKLNISENNDIIIKRMIGIIHPCEKGMGSAYGGRWQPKKPEDERFLGEPGEMKTSILVTKKESYIVKTKIGENRKAIWEAHMTDHGNGESHTNPHYHRITWDNGFPKFGKPFELSETMMDEINKFKESYMWNSKVKFTENTENVTNINIGSSHFESISEFKWCMSCGSEVEFEWKGKLYFISPKLQKTLESPEQLNISECHYEKDGKYYNTLSHEEYDFNTQLWADTADELLEYKIDGERLRDIITKVDVTMRVL